MPLKHHVNCRDLHTYSFPIVHTGNPDQDARSVYLCAWVSLLGDSPCGLKPRATVRFFHDRLAADFDGVVKEYASLAHHLMTSIIWRNGRLHSNVDALRFLNTPVFKEVVMFSRLRQAPVLRFLLTFLLFGKRTPQQDLDSFVSASLQKWMTTEDHISKVVLKDIPFIEDLATVIRWAIAPRYKHTFLPKHGGGAVADMAGTALSDKHKALTCDARIAHTFFGGLTSLRPDQVLPHTSEWLRNPSSVSSRVSELKLVPKDRFQARSICKEPSTLQYAQQSVRIALERSIALSPFGMATRLADQTYNQEAAREGSLSGHVDTIDLSNASDSVLVDLVRAIFPRRILKDLLATRSTSVLLPTGEKFVPKKFAPMGSAVCFPVQCIIYAAVCYVAYMYEFFPGKQVSRKSLSDLHKTINYGPQAEVSGVHALRVYGDDIICDSRTTSRIVSMLSSLGFSVNLEKSFTGAHAFRESCGGYYLAGADTTPLTMKLKDFEAESLSPRVFDGMMNAANRAWAYGYMNLRSFLLYYLHFSYSRVPRPLWYEDGTDGALQGQRPEFAPDPVYREPGVSNRGLPLQAKPAAPDGRSDDRVHIFYAGRKSRDNPQGLYPYDVDSRPGGIVPTMGEKLRSCDAYQRREQRVLRVTARSQKDVRDDLYAYIEWQRSPGTTEALVKPPWIPRDQEPAYSWCWVPAP